MKQGWTYRKDGDLRTAHLKPQDTVVEYDPKTDAFAVSMREPVTTTIVPAHVLHRLIYG